MTYLQTAWLLLKGFLILSVLFLACFFLLSLFYVLLIVVFPVLYVPMNRFWTWLFIIQGISFLIWISYYIAKPLIYYRTCIREMGKGMYLEPVNSTGSKFNMSSIPYRIFKSLFDDLQELSQQLKRNELEREEMEKFKQAWITGVSHDLKTPLSYIQGYAAMLVSEKYNWTEVENREFAKHIFDKAVEVNELIQELNDSTLNSDGHYSLFLKRENIVDFIRELVIDCANHPLAEQYEFDYESYGEHYPITIDRRLITRAIQNLLMNAVYHNPSGTKICCRVTTNKSAVHIQIHDNGKGITSKAALGQESGKGILIAKRFIELHQGTLSIEPAHSGGTQVEIELPIINPIT